MAFIKSKNTINHQLKIPDLLLSAIVEEYVNNIDDRPLRTAEILSFNDNGLKIDKNLRDCEIEWIPNNTWLPSMLWYHIEGINNQYYRYDICSLENLQLTSYGKGEFYSWHVDSHHNDDVSHERKLSFSLQLSDSDEYEGGDLQLMHPGYKKIETIRKEKGILTIFDSRITHRVRPITKGKRISLVGWAIGPAWR